METISILALEFGKMLGLPDLSARPENPSHRTIWPSRTVKSSA